MKCFTDITSASELGDVISRNLAGAFDHSFLQLVGLPMPASSAQAQQFRAKVVAYH